MWICWLMLCIHIDVLRILNQSMCIYINVMCMYIHVLYMSLQALYMISWTLCIYIIAVCIHIVVLCIRINALCICIACTVHSHICTVHVHCCTVYSIVSSIVYKLQLLSYTVISISIVIKLTGNSTYLFKFLYVCRWFIAVLSTFIFII